MSARPTWTYWITRDSANGQLSNLCRLWCRKPKREKHPRCVVWVDADPDFKSKVGIYTIAEIVAWFRVYPETDLELIKADVHPTDKELKDWEDSQPWEAAERG
jgi:hypothetical protein